MLSEKQLLANQKNALRSTGPRTPEGRAISSRNAMKHGLRSENTVIPGEHAEEFEQFRQLLLEDLAAEGAMEIFLADRIVAGFWKLRRAGRIETEMITSLHNAFVSEQLHSQQDAQRREKKELQKTALQQGCQNLHDPEDYQKIRTEWNNSEQARMIRENRWPRTPDHPSPDEAMKNFIADRTLALRRERMEALKLKIDHLTETAAPQVAVKMLAESVAIGAVMQQDISGGNILARFRVYEGQIERSLYKALTELQKLQILRSNRWCPEPSDD
ncbi:MAG: hypothetical protein ACYSU8_09440 [Planctomycetota bacterium]